MTITKTLRVRTADGWLTKPPPDLAENRLTALEVDDNFLALEAELVAHIEGADPHPQYQAEIGNYAALRAYDGPVTAYYVRGVANIFDGGAGVFHVDASDTTSADNGGTILVDVAARRWKREYAGPISILWFGADRSGTADSTAAIQAALNLADTTVLTIVASKVEAVTAAVHAPAGSYKTSAPLLVGEGTTFFGDSKSTALIKPTHAGVAIQMGGSSREYSNVVVRDLGVIGNRSGTLSYGLWATTTSVGIYAENCIRECAIQDCMVTQCQTNVKTENSYAFEISDNYLVYAIDYNIEIDNGVGGIITGNRIDWAEKHGIYVNGTAPGAGDETLTLLIQANQIQICWRNAVWLYDCSSVMVVSNFFEANYREAVDATTHVYADVNIETGANLRGYSFVVNGNFFTHGSSPAVDAYTAIRCNKAACLTAIGNVCRDSQYWRFIDASNVDVKRIVALGNSYEGSFSKIVYDSANTSGLIEEQTGAGEIQVPRFNAGSMRLGAAVSSSNQTTSDTRAIYFINCAAGNRNGYLRDVDCVPGRVYTFKKTDGGGNDLKVLPEVGSGKTIDGAAFISNLAAYGVTRVGSDGANWFVL